MAAKILMLLTVAAALSSGNCLNLVELPDETRNYITNDIFGVAISIAKSFLDTLESCYVIFPNGIVYEAYPEENIPHEGVEFTYSVQPFTSCGIGFRGVSTEYSGTYELLSTVVHSSDNSRTLTRQKFHMNIVYSDTWQVNKAEEISE